MDADFIAELDKDISNIGSEKHWKKTVGGVELWISPLTLIGQEKVSETIANSELGAAIVAESKRVTLAHAIVGIGKHDLRPYRHGSPVFPSKNKEGKPIKVALEKYIYEKLAYWGNEFVEDLFNVYADVMETHKKENLKDVKFDNLKTPSEELAELMLRVAEIREQLGLRPLVEAPEEATEEAEEASPPVVKQFDPFETVDDPGHEPPVYVGDPAASVAPKYVPKAPVIPESATAKPSFEVLPSQAGDKYAVELEASSALDQTITSTPQNPPVRDDVLESKSQPIVVDPPAIDRIVAPVNPRFAGPRR